MPSKKRAESFDLPDEEPPTIDPYEVLDLPRDVDDDHIKKAYRKAALKNHPDKVAKDQAEQAKETFQQIAFAYAILSDPRRRSRYDTTGSTSESLLDADDDFDWLEFYRSQYTEVVTNEKIEEFKKSYKGSEEERTDLLEKYTQFKGDMTKIYETVMLSNVLDDDERFRSILDEAIKKKEVEAHDKYVNESEKSRANRRKKALKEAEEAEKESEKIKTKKGKKAAAVNSDADLLAMIQKNQNGRKNFLADLEAKYAPKSKGKGKKRSPSDEPSEDAFQAAAERMKKARGAR